MCVMIGRMKGISAIILILACIIPLESSIAGSISSHNAIDSSVKSGAFVGIHQRFPRHQGQDGPVTRTGLASKPPSPAERKLGLMRSTKPRMPSVASRAQRAPTEVPTEVEHETGGKTALDRLIADALKTVEVSWKKMDDVNDGDSSR
eukprot:1761048-Rhodomonas_salina.1